MRDKWEVPFSKYDLQSVLANQLTKVNDAVLKIDQRRFNDETDDQLAAFVASQLVVSPLELYEDQIEVSSRDAKVDVRYDMIRIIFDKSRPVYVDGIEVVYHLPYSGDMELLKCRPSTYTLNPPRAVIESKYELTFPYGQADRKIANISLKLQSSFFT